MNRLALAALALICAGASARAQNYSSEDLTRRTIARRAVEAIIWGMPAVNYDLMYQALVRSKGDFNQIVYWSDLLNWRNQTLTPNPEAIYFMPFINTKDVGPMVLEIPPTDEGSITGTVMDCWQAALEDVGPNGVDEGKGGKYLMLPPGYSGKAPEGYIMLPSDTYEGYALLQAIPRTSSQVDIAKVVAHGRRIKLYPFSQADNPPPTTFIDAIDVVFDATIPYDLRFYRSLDRIVQSDVWLTRDKVMIDMLKSIGIEKGKRFNPNPKTLEILKAAVSEAHAWLETRDQINAVPFNESGHWLSLATPPVLEGAASAYAKPDSYGIDRRGVRYAYAYSSPKHVGVSKFSLMSVADKEGALLKGGNTYRLKVPANAPVRDFWSATVYDHTTHAFIRHVSRVDRSSQSPGLEPNSDGSVDIYFGPKAPAGRESNWVPTNPDGKFEVVFRFNGLEKPLFDNSWKLPDLEKISAH
jgi:hypothetical protein